MKFLAAIIIFLLLSSCKNSQTKVNQEIFNERKYLESKVEAFIFLSNYHHQLHVMIGEEEGDIETAYHQFSKAANELNSVELIPVNKALSRVQNLSTDSEDVKRLDYLVDYYQSGLSLQIEAILRGYGYLTTFPMERSVMIYDSLVNNGNIYE